VQQLHPFQPSPPLLQLRHELEKYPNVEETVWTQDEPLNAGAWAFVQPGMETILRQSSKHSDKQI
ncbi:hypothetical protein BZA05DRAFT_318680, partial [Tricharina praecox]|uniref:uncharacterized protein n=1 Tax=Tricharina praecox TaxID=43433 RepID=UPI0022207DDA